jgi:diguanylate cyclase (GGDEF)-like protein
MQEFEALLQRVRENEEILKRFHLLESKILSILNLKDFFENLLTEMMGIFQIPFVWVTIIRGSRLADMIDCVTHSDILRQRITFIEASAFHESFPNGPEPLLLNAGLSAYRGFFPQGRIYPIQSAAFSPVFIDGETTGSLNQGDHCETRFEEGMDTSLLEQLMLKISLCLSNVLAHERLRFFAYHDPLTGLLNRRAFEAECEREFSRAQRHGLSMSLVFSDLDDFKGINDRHGHDIGDRALQHVARTLESISRKEDVVSRFAGDEFVMLLPETDREKAGALMRRVEEALEARPLTSDSAELSISLSYGIASGCGGSIPMPDRLMKQADQALYEVKEKKKRLRQNSGPFSDTA